MKKLFDEKKTEQVFLLSEYGRQKLLGYADSFKEIAKTLEEDNHGKAGFTIESYGKTAVCWQKI